MLGTGVAAAGKLHAVTNRSCTLAAATVSTRSASFVTEHKMAPHTHVEHLDVNRQRITCYMFDECGEPALCSIAHVLCATPSAKETLFCSTSEDR